MNTFCENAELEDYQSKYRNDRDPIQIFHSDPSSSNEVPKIEILGETEHLPIVTRCKRGAILDLECQFKKWG